MKKDASFSEEKIEDPFKKDKRFSKTYSKQLIEYVNQVVRPDEQNIYKELASVIARENNITKPQDMLMLDIAIYDFLRIKRIQSILMKEGDIKTFTSKSGKTYTKANDAGYLLNAVETQFRNMLKEMGITGKESIKQKLGLETQDFATFMSEPTIVDAEEVKDDVKIQEE